MKYIIIKPRESSFRLPGWSSPPLAPRPHTWRCTPPADMVQRQSRTLHSCCIFFSVIELIQYFCLCIVHKTSSSWLNIPHFTLLTEILAVGVWSILCLNFFLNLSPISWIVLCPEADRCSDWFISTLNSHERNESNSSLHNRPPERFRWNYTIQIED